MLSLMFSTNIQQFTAFYEAPQASESTFGVSYHHGEMDKN